MALDLGCLGLPSVSDRRGYRNPDRTDSITGTGSRVPALMPRVDGQTMIPGCLQFAKAWGILSFFVASITGYSPAFSLRQEPLSWVRQRSGQGLHTSARNHTGVLSRKEKILLSRISIAGERGDWNQVQREFGTYTGQAVPIFNAVMHLACQLGHPSAGAAVYQRLCDSKISKTEPTYSAALKIYSKLGQTSAVREIWSEVAEAHPLNEVLAAARIDAAAAEGDVQTAGQILDCMAREAVKINLAHVNSAIRACWKARGKSHSAAKYLFNLIPGLGLKPDNVTFTSLIGAYTSADLADILAAYAKMKEAGVDVDKTFAEVYLVTVLLKPASHEIVPAALGRLPHDRILAAKAALKDFNAARIKLTRLSCAIERALHHLDG